MEMITLPDATLSSLALGAGERVVLVHGLVSGSMASWYFPFAQPLAAHRRVITYDLRGHGDSLVTAHGYDLDTQAGDLGAVIAHHGGDGPVDLVGHSMGALIALQFALRHPERVRRLILIDAPVPANRHVLPSLVAISSREALQNHVDAHHASGSGRRRERIQRRLSALILESSLIADVAAMGPPDSAELAALHCPVLLVYGRRSPCLDAADYLDAALPNGEVSLLDCGHYILEEAPAPLLAEMRRFLGIEAASRSPREGLFSHV